MTFIFAVGRVSSYSCVTTNLPIHRRGRLKLRLHGHDLIHRQSRRSISTSGRSPVDFDSVVLAPQMHVHRRHDHANVYNGQAKDGHLQRSMVLTLIRLLRRPNPVNFFVRKWLCAPVFAAACIVPLAGQSSSSSSNNQSAPDSQRDRSAGADERRRHPRKTCAMRLCGVAPGEGLAKPGAVCVAGAVSNTAAAACAVVPGK